MTFREGPFKIALAVRVAWQSSGIVFPVFGYFSESSGQESRIHSPLLEVPPVLEEVVLELVGDRLKRGERAAA